MLTKKTPPSFLRAERASRKSVIVAGVSAIADGDRGLPGTTLAGRGGEGWVAPD